MIKQINTQVKKSHKENLKTPSSLYQFNTYDWKNVLSFNQRRKRKVFGSLLEFDGNTHKLVYFELGIKGNLVYQNKHYSRVKEIENHLSNNLIHHLKRGWKSKYISNTFLFTTTFNPEKQSLGIKEGHRKSGLEFTYLLSKLRKRYGKVGYMKVVEIGKNGYPHYHIILVFENPIETFKSIEKGKTVYRLDNVLYTELKNDMDKIFNCKFDIRGITDNKGVEYVCKYLMKGYYHMVKFYEELEKDNYKVYDCINRLNREKKDNLVKGMLGYVIGYEYGIRMFSVSKGLFDMIGYDLPLVINGLSQNIEREFLEVMSMKKLIKHLSVLWNTPTDKIYIKDDKIQDIFSYEYEFM